MTKQFLVFQHMPWEGPGTHLVRTAKRWGIQLDILEVWRQPIPDVSLYDGLIVLGGSPNVDQEEQYPFLKAEKQAIRRVIGQDKLYLGFCLGHQLLAQALGARIGPNSWRSVGVIRGHLTKSGRRHPLFHGIPDAFPIFKWHSQAVLPPVPKEIDILAISPDCQVEAITVEQRPHLLGLQFDNHAAALDDVRRWAEGDQQWLSERPAVDTEALLEDMRNHESLIGEQFAVLFDNYVKLAL